MGNPIVPRCTIPSTPENIKAVLENAKHYARFVEQDARPLVRFCRKLRSYDTPAWETYFDDEPRTWERMCREVIGYDPAFLEEIEAGVAILEAEGLAVPLVKALEVAKRAKQAEPLAKHGGERNGEEEAGEQGSHTTLHRGSQYLTRRVARDHPEILERMRAGEYPSVRQAAIEAGIVTPTFTCPVDVQRAVGLIRKHFSEDAIAEIKEAL